MLLQNMPVHQNIRIFNKQINKQKS